MAADHLQFLKSKFLTDLQEAVEGLEELPLQPQLEEVAEVLRRRSIGASTPISMKNGLYDLRYLLAECVIWAEQERDRKSKSQNRKIQIELDAWHLKKLWFLHKTRKKLRRIRKELEGMRDEAVISNISRSLSTEAIIRVVCAGDLRWLTGEYARHVHGLDDKLQTIKAWLLCLPSNYDAADDGWKAIAIVGMGGVGKTTLARMFAYDYEATKHYSHFIWVRCSKETRLFDIDKSLLETLDNLYKANNQGDDDVRSRSCDHNLLGGKRFLILIDNVCNLENWHACSSTSASIRRDGWLKALFHQLGRRSRGAIIVTTRFQELGRSMAADNNLLKLEPNYGPDHLWSIFMDSIGRKRFLSPENHQTILRMKNEIVDRCDGLPLAAKTLAEVISIQLAKQEYWSNSAIIKSFQLRLDESDEISFLKIVEVLRHYPGVMDVAFETRNEKVRAIGKFDVVELVREFGKFWQIELIAVS